MHSSKLVIDDLPYADERFVLEECLGCGVSGKVYKAKDVEANRRVAIKMIKITRDNSLYLQEEYRVLAKFSTHPNIPEFYGAFRKTSDEDAEELWFVMELCEGGPVIDLVAALLDKNRRMSEEHIAFILKETVKALTQLHENRVMHRDVKASNILLTKDGEVKLCDFGTSRHLASTFGKSDTCLGSPCWMAPEVVTSSPKNEESGYGNRADVWALGICAIELGDGKPPFADMHPTRAMFQIVRNPPPTLYRPANWSETFNDFVNECLVKNPEHRPFIMEVMEHPFLAEIPENSYHLSQELKKLLEDLNLPKNQQRNLNETFVVTNFYKKSIDEEMKRLYVEDLAALEKINEETILQELQARIKQGHFHTYIGNVMLILNPNHQYDIYNEKFHAKYRGKSRSENEPHIYAMADAAYEDALHQIIPQNIVLGGESGSGKTTNFLHLMDHLLYVGRNDNINSNRIKDAIQLIHAFTHASTPYNDYSTRCVLKTEITFGSTGKVSGAVFGMFQLEKWRVSSVDMTQANYHMFYYFYDGMKDEGSLEKYQLGPDRKYRYLRISDENISKNKPRDNPENNVKKFEKLKKIFDIFEFEKEQVEMIYKILAAILIIGDIRFCESDEVAEIEDESVASAAAKLLGVDDKKLIWSLTNYCLIKRGTAVRRRHNCDEARDARDVFANTLYNRIVDYVINVINHKLSYGRTIFGDKYSVRILDIYGFECFRENHLTQLMVNCLNEQLHYHFVQRVFAWEAMEMSEENVPYTPIHYYDNKATLDEIFGKPDGVLIIIDDASRMGHGGEYIIDYLKNPEREHIKVISENEFAISHFTGKVTYTTTEMPERNRDFLPPEVIETLRLSKDKHVKSLFVGKLTRTGNLYTSFDEGTIKRKKNKPKLASSSSEEDTLGKTNEQQFSQVKKMRTTIATFRSLCLDLLKELSVGGSAGGTHFVRCLRSDLSGHAKGFHKEIVKQQIRAMAVVDTVKARQKGFPSRIPFHEFLRRYKFLAFDFDENVEISKENCRLLLVRLKMEGWMIGKSKVFLKYYNEEYLARLYETQVKKIVKIQSMMRGFLAKIHMKKRLTRNNSSYPLSEKDKEEDNAARVLQKAYRGVANRKAYDSMVLKPSEKLDASTCKFIRFYFDKWKAKSIFHVLLQYRAARYHDLFNLSQQVHLFNQQVVSNLHKYNNNIGLDLVDRHAKPQGWLGEPKPTVLKIPFRLVDIPFFDTSYMCDPLSNPSAAMDMEEEWDAPIRWRENVSSKMANSLSGNQTPKLAISKPYSSNIKNQSTLHKPAEHLINLPYCRDPEEPIRRLSSMGVEHEEEHEPYRRNFKSPPLAPTYKPTNTYNNNYLNGNTTRNVNNIYNKPARANPIAELKSIGRKQEVDDGSDEPPFNFQAMLRKTNVNRDSIRRGHVENGNFVNNYQNDFGNRSNFKREPSFGSKDQHNRREKLQLAPGIYMEGVVADL